MLRKLCGKLKRNSRVICGSQHKVSTKTTKTCYITCKTSDVKNKQTNKTKKQNKTKQKQTNIKNNEKALRILDNILIKER